jgi:hypothetical protein
MEKLRNAYEMLLRRSEGNEPLGGLDVDERIILKFILNMECVRLCGQNLLQGKNYRRTNWKAVMSI